MLTLTLVARQDLPSSHDNIVKHLQPQICRLLATRQTTRRLALTLGLGILGLGEDLVNQKPCIRVLLELWRVN